LKTNTVVDPKDLKEVTDEKGNKVLEHPTCGRVLPKGDKKIKPGYYIYEFYTPPKGKEDTFKKYPGFQEDSHPQGFCLPCCFNNWNTPDRITSRGKCMKEGAENQDKERIEKEEGQEEEEGEEEEVQKKEVESEFQPKKVESDEYIMGPDKFPLSRGRWGYLQISIQKFLNEPSSNMSTCQVNKNDSNIIESKSCLLRHGVEVSEKQSFIACIADAIYYARKDANGNFFKIPTIKQMKEIIISSITIDKFITYQNGNLTTNFYKINLNKEVDIEKYSNSKLYSKIDVKKEIELTYFKNVVNSFENFISYLKNDEVLIDFTYLWDIICKPNEYLFNSGINLVILKIVNNDITNNIELLCPSNHYSNEFYETRKPTLILINDGNFFEPIYSYKNDLKKKIISKVFSEYDPNLSPTLRGVFKKMIKPYLQNMCVPLSSMPTIYHAKKPLLLNNLIQILYKIKCSVLMQVVNYNSQVIGVISEYLFVNKNNNSSSKKSGFIPCLPSSINETFSYTFMIDNSLWNTYEETVDFLLNIASKSHNEIPCKPEFKIVEEEHVVGLITETNQFIPISKPLPLSEIKLYADIPSLENDNYISQGTGNNESFIPSDVIITTSNEVDRERVEYIKKIKLETNFYNVFRNTIRILLNDYKNIGLREKIESEILKPYLIYSEKLNTVNNLIRTLVGKKIEFTGNDDYYKKIEEVTTCIIENKNTCPKNICVLTKDDVCSLILPEKNLITKKNNDKTYYGKISDELIRYSRIQQFMFKPQSYLSFGTIGYNLKENEILIIQSVLNQEYFDNLVPALVNQFIEYNSFNQAEPIKSQVYENDVDLDNINNELNENICKTEILDKIKSSLWKKCFPNNYKEKEYSRNAYCTYHLIIDLIKAKTNKELTVNEVKIELYEEYKKFLPNYKEKILDILIIEGKKILGDQVKSNTLTFSSFIYSDNYFLTNLDLWLLIEKYKIPCFFISNKYLLETEYNKNIFLAYGDLRNDNFVFIVVPGFRIETIPNYKIILSDKEEIFISLNSIQQEEYSISIQQAIDNHINIEKYLEKFIKASKTNYQKKKPKPQTQNQVKLIIEEDQYETEEKPFKDLDQEDIIIVPKKKERKKKPLTEKVSGKKVIDKKTTRKNKP